MNFFFFLLQLYLSIILGLHDKVLVLGGGGHCEDKLGAAPPCGTEPVLPSSKMDPPLDKAEPFSEEG